jgi:hypothetical protein
MPNKIGRIRITKIESMSDSECEEELVSKKGRILSGMVNERVHQDRDAPQNTSGEMTIDELGRIESTSTPMNTPSMLPTPSSQLGFSQSIQLSSYLRQQVIRKQHELARECMQDVGVSMVVGSRSQSDHDLDVPNLTMMSSGTLST